MENEYAYKDAKTDLNVTDKYGYKYRISLDAFRSTIKNNSFPQKFGISNPFTINNIKNWLLINNKNFYIIGGDFINATEKNLMWKCSECGNEWSCSWNNVQCGKSCSICSLKNRGLKRRLEIDEVISLFEQNNITLLHPEEYSGYDIPMLSRCNRCGYIWKTSCNHTHSGNGCPKCKSSKGEKRIQQFLDRNNIEYIIQKRFSDCKDKKKLPFDFYIPIKNMCIEYNGEQHYRPIDYFGGDEKFNKLRKRDLIKQDYCANKNIELVVIPYLDFNNIEQILENLFIKN